MKIVFLPSAAQDIAWFRYYYRSVFPAGDENARNNLMAIQKLLAANPYVGHPSPSHDNLRELHVKKTPFTPVYRVTEVQIEILRLWDERQGAEY